MSYRSYEIKGGRKLSEMTESEQAYIHKEWDRLCARETVNTSEYVFIQKSNGRFFKAIRGRIAAMRYGGSAGGYWSIQYGNCLFWGFKKNPFGQFDPEPMDKFYSAKTMESGEIVNIPSKVHTKKEVIELAKKLGFEI